jgi:hypothetical protein
MTGQIIQLSDVKLSRTRAEIRTMVRDSIASHHPRISTEPFEQRERPLPPPLTETAKNSRIRIARRDAWWLADRVTDYWRARLDWQSELEYAQREGIGDSASFPPARYQEGRLDLVDKWREAVVKQLLTPAPDGGAVAWKRAKLQGRDFAHLPVKAERIERVIADDVAFLSAHPTRRRRTTP